MSAAAERAALAHVGSRLVALAGDRGERRARALLRRDPDPRAASFADLASAPGWLLRPRDTVSQLALSAALIAMAPALAASIDGNWLRALAERAGEDTLDHAIALAGSGPGAGMPAVPAEALEALGFDLLRAALPGVFHRYLAWGPTGGTTVPAALARVAIEAAQRGGGA